MHEHQRGYVDYLRVESVVSESLLDREPADRIHLVDRGDIDAVAVAQIGEQHVVTLAEVVDARSVHQEEVGLELGRYLLIHGIGNLCLGSGAYLREKSSSDERPLPGGSSVRAGEGPARDHCFMF